MVPMESRAGSASESGRGPEKTNLAILMVAVGDSVFFVRFHRLLPCGFYVQVQTSPG